MCVFVFARARAHVHLCGTLVQINDADEHNHAMDTLAEVMIDNPTLTEVYLYDNAIGEIGCNALGRGLQEFEGPMKLIDLRWTAVKGKGLRHLWKCLRENEYKTDDDIELRGIPTRRQMLD